MDPIVVEHRPDRASALVLLVEDEACVREVAADALRRSGFDVVSVSACDAALDVVRSRPDLRVLVTDVCTPGRLNGYELARIAREEIPHLAVLVVSARARPSHGDVTLGAWFVAKPFNLRVLVEVVREAMHLATRRAAC